MNKKVGTERGRALGTLVREARTAKGWSQRQMAERLGLGSGWQWVQLMESGGIDKPDAARMARLVGLLDLDPHALAQISGGYIPEQLPDVTAYLRTKYGATDEQLAEFERFRREIQLGDALAGPDGSADPDGAAL